MNHHQNEIQDKSLAVFMQAAAQKYGIPGVAIGEWEAGPGQFASAISEIDYWLQERREGLVRIHLAKQREHSKVVRQQEVKWHVWKPKRPRCH